jgi:biotin carboxyl carrier protein
MRTQWSDAAGTRVVEVTPEGPGQYRVAVDGAETGLTVEALDDGRLRVVTPTDAVVAEVTAAGSRRFVRVGAMDFVLERASDGRRRGAAAAMGSLEAPMPGVVSKVLVAPGEAVRKGQPLVAVEAMKMEHLVRAPRDGRVKKLSVKSGELVNGGTPLLELEDAPEAG